MGTGNLRWDCGRLWGQATFGGKTERQTDGPGDRKRCVQHGQTRFAICVRGGRVRGQTRRDRDRDRDRVTWGQAPVRCQDSFDGQCDADRPLETGIGDRHWGQTQGKGAWGGMRGQARIQRVRGYAQRSWRSWRLWGQALSDGGQAFIGNGAGTGAHPAWLAGAMGTGTMGTGTGGQWGQAPAGFLDVFDDHLDQAESAICRPLP